MKETRPYMLFLDSAYADNTSSGTYTNVYSWILPIPIVLKKKCFVVLDQLCFNDSGNNTSTNMNASISFLNGTGYDVISQGPSNVLDVFQFVPAGTSNFRSISMTGNAAMDTDKDIMQGIGELSPGTVISDIEFKLTRAVGNILPITRLAARLMFISKD